MVDSLSYLQEILDELEESGLFDGDVPRERMTMRTPDSWFPVFVRRQRFYNQFIIFIPKNKNPKKSKVGDCAVAPPLWFHLIFDVVIKNCLLGTCMY